MADYSASNPLVPPEAVSAWLRAVPHPIAITGGTGFVGSHLVETLCAAGVKPRVLVRDPEKPRWIGNAPVEWVRGSLHDAESLTRLVEGAGTIIHLAGVVRAGRAADFDRGNHEGTANLVAAAAGVAPSARFVHVSSLAAAGPSSEIEGVAPDCDPAPISWYGNSKLGAEREIRGLADRMWWTIVRPPAIYGPRDSDVFEFFKMANRGVIALPGGERWLTVAWVGDVVRSVLSATVAHDHEIYHLGEPEPMSLDELISELCKAGGAKAKIVKVPPAVVSSLGAVGSVLQKLGWRRLPLTGDKSRELLARHWTAQTRGSLERLGVDEVTRFTDGAVTTWAWYRDQGWLR